MICLRLVGVRERGFEAAMVLFAWEEKMLWKCCVILLDVVLQVDVVDTWKWYLDPSQCYIVCCVYHFLTTGDQPVHSTLSDLMLHKQVPLKVTLFA